MGFEFLGAWLEKWWDYLKPGFIVNEYQEAVLLTNGKYSGTFEPGFYFKFPFFEYPYEVNTQPDTMNIQPIPLTTKDNETIMLGLMIDYHVDPIPHVPKEERKRGWRIMETGSKKYIIDNNDSLSNLRDRAQGEMSDLIEDITWDDIRKKTTRTKLQKSLQNYAGDMGIVIDEVKFTSKSKSQVIFIANGHNDIPVIKAATAE